MCLRGFLPSWAHSHLQGPSFAEIMPCPFSCPWVQCLYVGQSSYFIPFHLVTSCTCHVTSCSWPSSCHSYAIYMQTTERHVLYNRSYQCGLRSQPVRTQRLIPNYTLCGLGQVITLSEHCGITVREATSLGCQEDRMSSFV